jgi:pyruvate,water dikinase
VETIQPIEAIVPRRAQPFGEFIRRTAVLMRAGLPLPSGYAVSRGAADEHFSLCFDHPEQVQQLLDPTGPLPSEAQVASLRERVLSGELAEPFQAQLAEVFATLHALGAQTLTVTAFLVCDKVQQERNLGEVRLGVDSVAGLTQALREAYALLFDRTLLRGLRGADARSASVAILVQRMLDGLVSGLVHTRHPITGDAHEWLVRSGYGLPSGVRLGRVAGDVIRVSRDGFIRDQVVAEKRQMLRANAAGQRELVAVAAPLVQRPCLTEAGLAEVLRVVARTERQVGACVLVDWIISAGRVYVLRVEPLPGTGKPPRARPQENVVREHALWSYSEVGESLPLPPLPLSWSLLAKFSRGGLASALSAAGAALGAAPELLMDVRGRPYLNLGVLTEAVCRLPGISAETLTRLGLDLPVASDDAERAGPLDMTRAALRLYDSHFRFGDELVTLSSRMADDRGHFAGLDARLLSPDAVERVLCDVEAFLGDVSPALMRVYGNWLATLLALRTLLSRYLDVDALRVEKDLLWGDAELPSVESGYDLIRVGRTLARDSRALAWADGEGGEPPAFVQEALDDFSVRHRHEGMVLLDPKSPRWRETPERLVGVMRAMLGDPLSLAFASERRELGKGRRERAEREWKRRVPLLLWPAVQLLLKRVRGLTRDRDRLLLDLAHGITVIREIAVDASRRLASRFPDLGSDAAFFLELSELHAALSRGSWDVSARVAMRRIEHSVLGQLPSAVPRFSSRPRDVRSQEPGLIGTSGSAGAAEGKVVCVRDGSELANLPRGAILVVPACDVGLSAVLPAVRGVISEHGGPLSQGAALAHALGVPVVIGVPDVMRRVVPGERVRVDADHARVERL